jgi:IS30 family transposase
MPRYASNKMSVVVERRYLSWFGRDIGVTAADRVGVSLNCGSSWFVDTGRANFRGEADQLAVFEPGRPDRERRRLRRGDSVKTIAARISKSYQTVFREVDRNRKPGGCTSPGTPQPSPSA